MSKFQEFWRAHGAKVGGSVGGLFTLCIVGLLVWAHLFATLETPLTSPWEDPPKVAVCEGAPGFVGAELDRVVTTLEERGLSPAEVLEDPIPCNTTKVVEENGSERPIPYQEGMILIALRDQFFSEEHAGETIRWWEEGPNGERRTLAATILLPSMILGSDDPMSDKRLPSDAEYLVLLHEYVHAWGYDHVVTRVFGPFRMEKSGHLMTRSIFDAGPDLTSIGTE